MPLAKGTVAAFVPCAGARAQPGARGEGSLMLQVPVTSKPLDADIRRLGSQRNELR